MLSATFKMHAVTGIFKKTKPNQTDQQKEEITVGKKDKPKRVCSQQFSAGLTWAVNDWLVF